MGYSYKLCKSIDKAWVRMEVYALAMSVNLSPIYTSPVKNTLCISTHPILVDRRLKYCIQRLCSTGTVYASFADPLSTGPKKALENIGSSLQRQYERWQPRARSKLSLDPTLDEVKKLCQSLRRNAKVGRVDLKLQPLSCLRSSLLWKLPS